MLTYFLDLCRSDHPQMVSLAKASAYKPRFINAWPEAGNPVGIVGLTCKLLCKHPSLLQNYAYAASAERWLIKTVLNVCKALGKCLPTDTSDFSISSIIQFKVLTRELFRKLSANLH